MRYLEVYPIQFANETHWYTRVILYGRVPSKGKRLSRAVGGADIGTSTVAFASPTLVEMRVLGGEPKHYDAQIRELSRRIDESTRATNPNNYNDDGTIKKRYRDTSGVLVPLSWVVSSHCRALQAKRRALYRKKALSLRQSHCEVANLMARHAGIIYTEKMNWAGLAKRAARRTDEKTGREKARARFGKSIGSHAPALFEKVLAWRLFALGGELRYVNTFSFRASQLDHITGECVKTRLGQRSKVIGGVTVQRDMYSAFLLWHSRSDSASADRAWCVEDFARYVALERGFRARAVGSGLCRNACFGF